MTDASEPEPNRREPASGPQADPGHDLRALGMLAAGVAHDFNNILTAVAGHVQLAIAEIDRGEPQDARAFLEQAASGCRRGSIAVQQLLSLTRLPGEEVEIDLSEAVSRAVDLLRGAAPHDVELRLALADAPATIRAHRIQIDQIVLNLCANAWQAMPDNRGVIEVRVETEAEKARLVVRDDGRGVPAEIRERIFEPFFTTKPAGRGTGLGLAVVRGIVAQMGGEIAVESPAGGGAEFRVELPLCGPTDA